MDISSNKLLRYTGDSIAIGTNTLTFYNDGTIENMFIEPGQNDFSDDDDPYTVSSPEHVLSKL